MSVLLEVRGASTQNSEEKPFSEGITQHSGSQYGGDPLVSIWGDRLTSSIWHATAVSSPSITPVTTTSPSFFPMSIASETMDNEDRFSSTSSSSCDHSRRKGKESISGQAGSEFEASKGAFKQIVSDKTNYSFGATRSNPNTSGMPYPTGLTKDWKPGIKFSDDPHHTPFNFQPTFTSSPTISSEEKEEIAEKRDLISTSCSANYMTSNSTNNSNEVHESISEHKEVPGMFVFGASIPSAVHIRHVSPHQRMFESLFVPSSPRTRNKYKRHLRLNKSGFGSNDTQQSAYFSREEVSPLKSSQVEDAEKYLDVNTGPEDNQGVNVDGLQQSKSIFIFGSDSVLHQNEESKNQQSFLSKYDQNKIVEQMDNVEGHFSSFTSTKDSNEESRKTNDQVRTSAWGFLKEGISFSKAKDGNVLEEEEDVGNPLPVMAGSGDPQKTPDNDTGTDYSEKNNVHEFLHQTSNTGATPESAPGQYSFKDDFSSKKINQNDANFSRAMQDEKGKHEYLWNSGSNALPQPYVFGSLHASSMQVASQSNSLLSPEKDNMQETRRNSKGSHECVSNDQAEKQDDMTLPASSFSIPDVKNFGSLIDEHSQSYSSSSFMNVEGSFPGPHLNFTVQENRIQNEFPRGEFSGPISSSESSEPESSPSRTEKNLSGDGILHPKQYFEFQGNLKNTVAGSAMGKEKVGLSLNSRRQRKGLNKLRITHKNGEIYSSVTKGPLSSMNFSSIMKNANPEDRIVNLEQLPENSNNLSEEWAEFKMEDKDHLMQFMENQSMEDLQKAAANLRIQKDKKSSKSPSSNQESGVVEGSMEWMSSTLASKRSGSWKRSDFEEGECVSRLENHSGTSLLGGGNEFANNHNGESYSSSFEPSQEVLSFTVGTHSQMSKVIEPIFPTTGRMGGSFDKRSSRPQRRWFSKINQSSIQKKNSEPPPSSSASTNAVDAGMLESMSAGKSDAAERACEAWRLRGNLAYESGDYPRAEEYYSRGASSVSPSETSQSCIRASMLCYSNRAATRMAVGRMREALDDCKRAMVIDSSFVRVRLRAALCHLALGESKAATSFFKECIKYAKNSTEPNSKMLGDATEGAKKAQQLDDYSDRAIQLLSKENSTDSTAALRLVNEALSISPFSEALHELKITALISLKRYEEALQWCEQTLPAAEKSHGVTVNEQHQDNFSNRATQSNENFHHKRWRWRLSAKCLYYLGKLDEAVDLLEKHEASLPTNIPDKNVDSLEKFMNSIRELARHKAAGNKAFQMGKHAEAVEHYTAALACNGESRPYNAVCFCNRAAASQALGHITDAIADCSRAIALDSSYPKALSRRATLHEMIRDFGQACNDLRRLITVLENNRSNERESQLSKEGVNVHDLKQAQDRLAKVEEEMQKGAPVDHYLLLGVDSTCSANEIKKAYRKAALKHHPDKASQFLKRENGDVGSLWKEVSIDEVRADAERLFKLIGEANAILSDPVKRSRYDNEEKRRQMRVTSSNFVPRTDSDSFRHQYENSGSGLPPHYRWENRTASTNPTYTQHQRWQSAPDAAQPDIYARNRSNGGRTSTSEFSWDTS